MDRFHQYQFLFPCTAHLTLILFYKTNRILWPNVNKSLLHDLVAIRNGPNPP